MHIAFSKLAEKLADVELALQNRTDVQENTEACLSAASACIAVGKSSPDVLLAFAFLPDTPPHKITDVVRIASLLTFVTLKFQYNEHYIQHIVGAAIASACLVNKSAVDKERYRECWRKSHLVQFLSLQKFGKLLTVPSAFRYLQSKTLHEEQMWFVCVLSLLENKTPDFVGKLKPVALKIGATNARHLESLLSYPGQLLPGQTVSLPKGTGIYLYRLSADACVVWHTAEKVVEEVHCKVIKRDSREAVVSLPEWLHFVARSDNKMKPMVQQLLPVTYPVSRLPSHLKSVIHDLHDSNVDISKLANKIAGVPVFADFLTETASIDNRLQIPVKDVKQAILTYGLTRVADMLIMRALTQRLHQRHFPLQATFMRFCELLCAITSELTDLTCSKQSPQTAALIATFATAPLFTIPGLKTLKCWPQRTNRLYDLNTLVRSETQPIIDYAASLAKQWQQPSRYLAIITHSHLAANLPESVRTDATILGLSAFLTRNWLLDEQPDESSRRYFNNALTLLRVSRPQLEAIKVHLSASIWLPLRQ